MSQSLICNDCPRKTYCDYPCAKYLGEENKNNNNTSQSINRNTCFVNTLADYYFKYLPIDKQIDDNLHLLWEAGIYLEKYFKTCKGKDEW